MASRMDDGIMAMMRACSVSVRLLLLWTTGRPGRFTITIYHWLRVATCTVALTGI
jgi:hypothetical protein